MARASPTLLSVIVPIVVMALALAGCAPTPPERPAVAEVAVQAEPGAPFDAVPSVVRFRVTGLTIPAAGVLLFEDALSSYHEARVRGADLPSTLAERRVPALAFEQTATGDIVVVPSRPLRHGGTYALAALGTGTLTTLVVDSEEDDAPYAARVFPSGVLPGGSRWVFCGAPLASAVSLRLEPGDVEATATPGVVTAGDVADCFHLDVRAPAEGLVVPPPRAGDIALDPAPVSFRPAPLPPVSVPCKPGEAVFGPGCVFVSDDRLVVRAPAAPLVWALRVDARSVVETTVATGRFVVSGLAPASDVVVSGAALDERGRQSSIDVTLRTAPSVPHLVINEVLANPNGPEPAGEWVELVNDGEGALSLAAFTLGDEAAESPLPDVTLEPGDFALVVPSDFDVRSHVDVAPAEGTLVVRIPRLGQSGLSNSGERVLLRGPGGALVSSFPAMPAPASGVSAARRTPDALDDDPSGFGASAGKGASPGAPNDVAAPIP